MITIANRISITKQNDHKAWHHVTVTCLQWWFQHFWFPLLSYFHVLVKQGHHMVTICNFLPAFPKIFLVRSWQTCWSQMATLWLQNAGASSLKVRHQEFNHVTIGYKDWWYISLIQSCHKFEWTLFLVRTTCILAISDIPSNFLKG